MSLRPTAFPILETIICQSLLFNFRRIVCVLFCVLHRLNFYLPSKNDSNWSLSSLGRLPPLLVDPFSCLLFFLVYHSRLLFLTKHKTLLHLAGILPKFFFPETNHILNARTQTILNCSESQIFHGHTFPEVSTIVRNVECLQSKCYHC